MATPGDYHPCLRCGSTDKWNVLDLRTTEERDEKTIYVYNVICTQCSRPSTYRTDDPNAVPARNRIRDELFSAAPRNPAAQWESDLDGFDPESVKPRLTKEK